MEHWGVIWGAIILAASPEPPGAPEPGDQFCRYVRSVADSESSTLLWPDVYGQGGLPPWDSAVPSEGAVGPWASPVLTLGMRYNPVHTYQGMLVRQHAEAECRSYRARTQLEVFTRDWQELCDQPALQARAEALQAALPKLQELLRNARADVEAARATVQELHATELRAEALQEQLASARAQLARLVRPARPPAAPASLLQDYREAERQAQRVEAELRAAKAWEVTVRAGYTRALDRPEPTPLFGMVTVAFNLGRFAQPGAEARAGSAFEGWSATRRDGPAQQLEAALHELEQLRAVERQRLADSEELLADLEERHKAVGALELNRARRFGDYIWFDLIKQQAEHAYLRAHVRALDEFLGGGGKSDALDARGGGDAPGGSGPARRAGPRAAGAPEGDRRPDPAER